jgi:hypothetical protein
MTQLQQEMIDFIDWLYDNGFRAALAQFCQKFRIGERELVAWRKM